MVFQLPHGSRLRDARNFLEGKVGKLAVECQSRKFANRRALDWEIKFVAWTRFPRRQRNQAVTGCKESLQEGHSKTMPTTGPEEPQNGETSLNNLFNDDDDAEMMLVDEEKADDPISRTT